MSPSSILKVICASRVPISPRGGGTEIRRPGRNGETGRSTQRRCIELRARWFSRFALPRRRTRRLACEARLGPSEWKRCRRPGSARRRCTGLPNRPGDVTRERVMRFTPNMTPTCSRARIASYTVLAQPAASAIPSYDGESLAGRGVVEAPEQRGEHRHQTPNPEQEVQANIFASEILMPTPEIKSQFHNPSNSRFMELKLYWGASMQALIYKAWQIGRISDRMFKYYNIEMSKRGFRTKEPIEWNGSAESAATLRQLVATYVDELEYSTGDFGDLFGLMDDEVEALFPLPGKKKPQLKLVL
jgi:IrrE N-terminal-like domain